MVLRVWGTEWWIQTEYLIWYSMQLQGLEVNIMLLVERDGKAW